MAWKGQDDRWLCTFGIDKDSLVHSPARDWVTLEVPVSLAEKMLDTVSLWNLFLWAITLCGIYESPPSFFLQYVTKVLKLPFFGLPQSAFLQYNYPSILYKSNTSGA